MRDQTRIAAGLLCGLWLAAGSLPAQTQQIPPSYQEVLNYLARTGDYKDNVLKVNIPRNDIKVSIDGVATPMPFDFGGWLAMTKNRAGTDVMMGDLVLTQDEVNPVMSVLLDHGLEVVAIHQHMTDTQPMVFFLHYWGRGPAEKLAAGFKAALDQLGKAHPAAHADAAGMSGMRARNAAPVLEAQPAP